jgi:hypothetical protein
MVYKSKAQIQAELVGVILVTPLDDNDVDVDVDFEGGDEWLDDMDAELDDALQYVALRVLEFAQLISGSGSFHMMGLLVPKTALLHYFFFL